MPPSNGTNFDAKGNKYEAIAPAAYSAEQAVKAARVRLNEQYGKTPFILGWHEIRQLLVQFLPEGIVMFDKQVTIQSTCSVTMQACAMPYAFDLVLQPAKSKIPCWQ